MSALKKFKLKLKNNNNHNNHNNHNHNNNQINHNNHNNQNNNHDKKLYGTIQLGKRQKVGKKQANYKTLILDNPFEKKFEKTKFEIVNKKTTSIHSSKIPRPGRKRALEFGKKRDSLKLELENRKRENVMVDKRFGEYDHTMSVEDKMLIRYRLESRHLLFVVFVLLCVYYCV